MNKFIDKVNNLIKPLLRITLAFAASSILFELLTEIKLFNIDALYNASKFLNIFNNDIILGVISIIILYNFLTKK
tara:strand:+ start:566 stop:790 length:225 start_codon:yes stop_codon:yes gene_type:complete